MKRVLVFAGVSLAVAAVVFLTAVPLAQGGVFSTTYYNIYFRNMTQYQYASSLAPYLERANWAGTSTLGWEGWHGKMRIYFVSRKNGLDGWMDGGYQNIYLNTKYFKSFDKWGSVAAEQTAKVLFYNVTQAHLWNSHLLYNITFLTESLAWYAGDFVYYYHKKKYTAAAWTSTIRGKLKYYAARTGGPLSWTDCGRFYLKGSGNYRNHAIWSFRATAIFLIERPKSKEHVRKLVGYMGKLSSAKGEFLRSENYGRALVYFEYAFKYAYSRRANAGWTYTGSSNGAYKSWNYLYGFFWYYFYIATWV